jgi:hypothetical protein
MMPELFVLMLVLVIENERPTQTLNIQRGVQKKITRDSSTSLGMKERRMHVYPTAAITLSSIAIGVGSAVTSIVVRVGFGLAGPAKYSA